MTVYMVTYHYGDGTDSILALYYTEEAARAHAAKVDGCSVSSWEVQTEPALDCLHPDWCGGTELCLHCRVPR